MNKNEILEYLEINKEERGMRYWKNAGIKGMSSYGIGVTKLKAFAKKIGKNHDLALELWKENNYEVKIISTLIDDPKIITRSQINEQVKEVSFWLISHAYCGYLLPKYPGIKELSEEWAVSSNDLERRCGFQLLYNLAKDNKKLPNSYFNPIISRIENELQQEENFVKDAMNNALLTIGMRNKELNRKCIGVAKKIGQVHVDYGDNSCQAIDVVKHLTSERILKKLTKTAQG